MSICTIYLPYLPALRWRVPLPYPGRAHPQQLELVPERRLPLAADRIIRSGRASSPLSRCTSRSTGGWFKSAPVYVAMGRPQHLQRLATGSKMGEQLPGLGRILTGTKA